MKWNVEVDLNASVVITVEAGSEEEARNKALKEAYKMLLTSPKGIEVYEVSGIMGIEMEEY
jgi:hypothetical protein